MIELYSAIAVCAFIILSLMCAANVHAGEPLKWEDIGYVTFLTVLWPLFLLITYLVIRDALKDNNYKIF